MNEEKADKPKDESAEEDLDVVEEVDELNMMEIGTIEEVSKYAADKKRA